MSTEKRKFQVTQTIPATKYVTYLVEAENEDEAIELVAVNYLRPESVGIVEIVTEVEESEFEDDYEYEAYTYQG